MFASDITRWLNGNMTTGSKAYVVEHQAEIRDCLADLGVSAGTELAYFYLHFDASAVSGWYSLYEIDQLQDATEYAHSELEVPADYIALTGTEGEGIVLYQRDTHAVYDVPFGQFDALASGSLKPVAISFQDFLRWCKGQSDAS